MTTNAGRSWFSLPSPYDTHEPMLGPAGKLSPGLEKRDGRVVVDRLGVHRADEAKLVGDLRRERQQLGQGRAALAVASERETGWPPPESGPAARSCPSAAAPSGSSREGPSPAIARAPAWDRRDPSATAHPTETGRSPAWRAARSSESPSIPAPACDRPAFPSRRVRARDCRARPGRSSPARRRHGRRSAGE